MKQVEERYISLLTDFGFKRIFGSAPNKDLLICFLNSLFNGRQVVKDVKYLNPENVGDIYTDRKAIFDVYCEGENGEKFIVEMQNAYQTYFKDRALFYSTFPVREQAPKGSEWDFKLNHVYTIALLNFNMNEEAFNKEEIRHHVQLCDTATHKIFYDKLEFIYVEIAKFNKSLDELETLYDKWLYALKNLYKLTQRPKALCDKVFDRLFEEAEIAKFTPQEQREYEASKMAYRDIKNSIDTAKREGKEEGLAEGMEKGLAEGMKKGLAEGMEKGMNKRSLEIARKMLADPAGTRRGTFRPRAVPQGAGGIRRQPGVFRRGRRTARFGAATLFLCHRDPDVPGIRTLGSYTRHFDQFAQVPLAQVRIVGQDSRTARPENPRRRGARAAARPKG